MNIVSVCNKIIRYSFYLLFFLVPLILTPWNYELFEFNKMIVTYTLAIVIFSAWLMKMAASRTISIRRTPLDVPIVLFLLFQLISALFSMDPHISWFGYYSRFNGGMLSLFSYVILYYAFISNVEQKEQKNAIQPAFQSKHIATLLLVTIASALLVSFYGILQRMGIDKHLWVQDVQNRVFSTLGQPNWLAAYLVALLPVSLSFGLAAQEKDKRNHMINGTYIMWMVISSVLFTTLLATKSRSGMTAFAISFVIFAVIMLVKTKHVKKIAVSLLIPLLLFFGSIFFLKTGISSVDSYLTLEGLQQRVVRQTSVPSNEPVAITQTGTMLESGGTESGTIRKYVWEGALSAWQSSPKTFLIGTGTETFAFAFFKYKPVTHNLTSEWDFLYNKAHNEYLNYLATTGVFGFLSYALFLLLFIIWMILILKKQSISSEEKEATQDNIRLFSVSTSSVTQLPVVLGLFAGWISILVTNFFGFSVVIMQLFLILFPAIIFALIQKDHKRLHYNYAHLPKVISIGLGFTAVLIATLSLSYIGVYWLADKLYAQGYRQSRQGQLADAYQSLTQAILLRPTEPNYFDEIGVVLSGLSVASMEAGSATTASALAEQAILASDKALSISPNNVNYWKSRTKIYFGFAGADQQFVEAAINALEQALALSPYDPKITYNLAVLYGRLGDNTKAIELLNQTRELKPNYRDAFYALYIFLLEGKQPDQAKAILQRYLDTVDPNDKDFQSKITQPDPATLPQ
jgi:Flp pilus assembly protein TadD/O-antigen ligase